VTAAAWSDAWSAITTPAQHPFDRGEAGEPTDGPTCWDVGIDLDREWTMVFGPSTEGD
jgi:hypothetical protein